MNFRSIMLVTAALSFSASTTAWAQAADQSTSVPAPQAKKTRDPNEVVCQKIEVVGSRLATKKICMTRSEWALQQRDDRMATDKVQILRPCNGSAGC